MKPPRVNAIPPQMVLGVQGWKCQSSPLPPRCWGDGAKRSGELSHPGVFVSGGGCPWDPQSPPPHHETGTYRGSSATASTFGTRSTNSTLWRRKKRRRGVSHSVGLDPERVGGEWGDNLRQGQEHQWGQQGRGDRHHPWLQHHQFHL